MLRCKTSEIFLEANSIEHDNVLELLDGFIDLAARRLLLMIDFGDIKDGHTAQQALYWGERESLRDCVVANLSASPPQKYKMFNLQRMFNARSLAHDHRPGNPFHRQLVGPS